MPSVSFSRFLFFSLYLVQAFIYFQSDIHNPQPLLFIFSHMPYSQTYKLCYCDSNGSFTSCCTVHGKECLHAHKDTSILAYSKFCLNKKVLLVIYNNTITIDVVVGIMGWIVLRHIIITIFSYSFTFLTQCININTSLIIIVV